MRQYARFKQRHPGCLLLFRIGDFYEMFDDDAVEASKAIGLTLTQRTAGIPMAGVPFHQLENYLRKFLAAGFRVAVCEQVQDAAEAKGIVERAVTRVLTPGTLVDENLLDEDRASTIAAVAFPPEFAAAASSGAGATPRRDGVAPGADAAALAVAELSTGSFVVVRCSASALGDELARRQVSEVVYAETADGKPPPRIAAALAGGGAAGGGGLHATPRPQWQFRQAEAVEALRAQFGVATLEGFGFASHDPLLTAAGALIAYLRATQSPGEGEDAGAQARSRASPLAHLRPPAREREDETLVLEASTLRALEVDRTIRSPAARGSAPGDGSLLGVFSAGVGRGSCRTAMGKRLLREWLCRPSARLEEIRRRQASVSCLVEDRRLAQETGAALAGVQDVPRIAARVALGRATPRDVVALGQSLARSAALDAATVNVGPLAWARGRLEQSGGLLDALAREVLGACVESPPGHLREGGLFRDGHDAALDDARTLQARAGAWCADYQAKLIAEHDLPSLKVGFNKIFGYYIELPKAQAARAPAVFSRRQTLTGAERYVTPELKAFEDDVTSATARAVAREQALFAGLCQRVVASLGPISTFAEVAAEIDVLLAMADKAAARRWVRPEMVDAPVLKITQGRHPVLDESLGTNFVPNDVNLGAPAQAPPGGAPPAPDAEPLPALALITGPNMAGKSTFIRQAALLTLLAHAGSFIPAESATIGLTDRIFTRVGADDALHAGQSTFMVEMTETASILHHASGRSLVILDEIGRGTSTLDGLSLAWAIAETLAGAASGTAKAHAHRAAAMPRTLFATHYHELTQLQESLPGRVQNLHVAVREWGEQIVFLHRILPGRTDRSYGVHVAKLAGLPAATIARAREILAALSVEHEGLGTDHPSRRSSRATPSIKPSAGDQLALFKEFLPHPAVDALREINLDALSPIQAFDQLRRLKDLADDPTAGA